jgi:glutamine amidotransferase
MIAIINGCGTNFASVQAALERLEKKSILTTDKKIITSASHVILPGVGTANHAMSTLQELDLIEVICALKQPVLGICVGMQILYEYSCEGNVNCLGIFPGKVEPLAQNADDNLVLPHMGWNKVFLSQSQSPLIEGIESESYLYFVHSYAARVNENTLAYTHYGSNFSAIVQKNNFYGVQFHPERSGKTGEKILQNFVTT